MEYFEIFHPQFYVADTLTSGAQRHYFIAHVHQPTRALISLMLIRDQAGLRLSFIFPEPFLTRTLDKQIPLLPLPG